jgi:WhiB family redox-sensing transcriptional regulator
VTANRRFVAQPANPGEWATQAACKGLTALFALNTNAHRGHGTRLAVQASHARTVCTTCPVLEPCREWALTEPDPAYHMIAGGLDPHQRRLIRRTAS